MTRRTALDYLYMLLLAAAAVVVLVILGRAQEHAQLELLREIRNASRAEACVLALPQLPEIGRDPVGVSECFRDNGLAPPEVP